MSLQPENMQNKSEAAPVAFHKKEAEKVGGGWSAVLVRCW
jgi:hypothetical protein